MMGRILDSDNSWFGVLMAVGDEAFYSYGILWGCLSHLGQGAEQGAWLKDQPLSRR